MTETINLSNYETIDVNEYAELLGISIDTAYYWRQIGKGAKAVRIGKRLRYRKSDVLAYLDGEFAK